jgi:hypothetical protein
MRRAGTLTASKSRARYGLVVASPFRVPAGEAPRDAAPVSAGRAMRVEHFLVLAVTTPVLILGVVMHRPFGVALTIALFAWLFSVLSLVRSRR